MSMMHGHSHGHTGSTGAGSSGQYQDPRAGHGQTSSMYHGYNVPYATHPALFPPMNQMSRRR